MSNGDLLKKESPRLRYTCIFNTIKQIDELVATF
jgi:hypothetical protein